MKISVYKLRIIIGLIEYVNKIQLPQIKNSNDYSNFHNIINYQK